MDKLNNKVIITVPSTVDVNKEIDNKEYVERTATFLSECFGGATANSVQGYWVSDSVGLVKERSVTVFSNCSKKDLVNKKDKVFDFCKKLCIEMRQDAVALEINGEMIFIPKDFQRRRKFLSFFGR